MAYLERREGETKDQYQLRQARVDLREAQAKIDELEEIRRIKLPAVPEKLDFRKITRPHGLGG